MADITNDFETVFKFYADYYRFLDLNDERVYNHIIETIKKKTNNPNLNDFIKMTKKVYYKQAKVRFEQDKKYVEALFEQLFNEDDITKSLNNINLIIVKSGYDLTFEVGFLLLNKYPSLKTYIFQNDVRNNYLLTKLKEILELVQEEDKIEDFKDDDIIIDEDILRAYFKEIKSIPILKWEEQKALAYKVLEGDEEAKEKLISSNLRLVVSFAKRYIGRGLELLDLIGAGNEGLLKAVKYYNPDIGYRFSTYASWWIKQSITRSIANEGRIIRIPVHYGEEINKFRHNVRELEKKLGREPTYKDIVKHTHYSESEIKDLLKNSNSLTSLNLQIEGDDKGNELLEFIPDETNIENQVLDKEFYNGAVRLMQKILNDRLLMVVILRLDIDDRAPKKLEEIGLIMGVTRERVRQIQLKACDCLINNEAFKAYFKYRENIPVYPSSKSGISHLLNVDSEKLNEFVKLLPSKEQELLIKRYGDDLSIVKNFDMDLRELTYIYEIIYPKLRIMLTEERLFSLKEAFGSAYFNEVITQHLTSKEQEIVVKQGIIPIEIEEKIITGLATNLKDKTLISFLSNYDPKVTNLVIDILFPDAPNFFNKDSKTQKMYIKQFSSKLTKIKNVLSKKITLYDLFSDVRKNTLDKDLLSLDKPDQEILKQAFGPTYQDAIKIEDEESLKAVIKKLKLIRKRKTNKTTYKVDFYEYFNIKKEDRFYIQIALDSLKDYQLDVVKKKYGENFLDDSTHNSRLKSSEYYTLKVTRKVLEARVEFLKMQDKEKKNYFFDEFLRIDKAKNYNLVKASIENLDDRNKKLLITYFGAHYLDYPLDLASKSEKTLLGDLKNAILSGLTIETTSQINIFYQYLKVPIEDKYYLEEVIKFLTPLQRLNLEERFGKDFLNNPTINSVTNNTLSRVAMTRKKILKDINALKSGKSLKMRNRKGSSDINGNVFFKYLNLDYDQDKILVEEVFKLLPEEQQEAIISTFGSDFINNPIYRTIKDEEINKKLIYAARNIRKYVTAELKEFYEYLGLTKEDMPYIEIAVKELSDINLNAIKRKHGEDFLHKVIRPKPLNKKNNIYYVNAIKKLINTVDKLKNVNKENVFFKYLKLDYDQDKALVEEAIKKLRKEQLEAIVLVYGNDFIDNPVYKKTNDEEVKKKLISAARYIRKCVAFEPKEFYEYLELTKEDMPYIEAALKKLRKEQLQALMKRYGDDFLHKVSPSKSLTQVELRDFWNAQRGLLSKIELLKEKGVEKNYFFRDLKLMYNHDKPYVVYAIKELPAEYITLFKEVYGNDFIDNPKANKEIMNPKLNEALQILGDKVNTLKTDYKIGSFYDFLGIKEDSIYIPEVLQSLSDKNIKLIKSIWGEDYLVNPIRKHLNHSKSNNLLYVKNIILDKIKELKKRNLDKDLVKVINISYATSLELKINSEFANWFNYLKTYLVVSDALIICLYLGFYKRKFTTQELSIIFGTTEKVMLLKLKEIISSLKQYQSQGIKLDDLIVNLNAKLENASSLELDKKL